MPRMILLNGPPSCGKSTLARRYAQEHPLSLNLDVDRIRQRCRHAGRDACGCPRGGTGVEYVINGCAAARLSHIIG
jgi:predicted kinase